MFRGRLCCNPLDVQSHSAKSSKYVLLQDGFRRNAKFLLLKARREWGGESTHILGSKNM